MTRPRQFTRDDIKPGSKWRTKTPPVMAVRVISLRGDTVAVDWGGYGWNEWPVNGFLAEFEMTKAARARGER